MLKHEQKAMSGGGGGQPPSGGCVLKRRLFDNKLDPWTAAFGRLCVETEVERKAKEMGVAAAFGRLCVETRTKVPSK